MGQGNQAVGYKVLKTGNSYWSLYKRKSHRSTTITTPKPPVKVQTAKKVSRPPKNDTTTIIFQDIINTFRLAWIDLIKLQKGASG